MGQTVAPFPDGGSGNPTVACVGGLTTDGSLLPCALQEPDDAGSNQGCLEAQLFCGTTSLVRVDFTSDGLGDAVGPSLPCGYTLGWTYAGRTLKPCP